MTASDGVLDLSVVIPARNEAAFVAEAVRSALALEGVALEVIVVDDGSSDDTAEQAAAAGGSAVRVLSQPATGLSAARNRGLSSARAPLVLFLDADDRLCTSAFQQLHRALSQDPCAVAAYGEVQVIDERGETVGPARRAWFSARPSGDVLEGLLGGNFIATMGAVLLRMQVIRDLGGFAEELRAYEDWELLCRIASAGRVVYAGQRPVLEKRRRTASVSSSYGDRFGEAQLAVDRVFTSEAVRARFTGAAGERLYRRRMAFQRALSAVECLRQGRATDARRHLGAALRLDARRPREWILYACAVVGALPGPIARRLK